MVHIPKDFSDAAMKFVPFIISVYLPKSDEIVEPESMHHAPSIPETHSVDKFVRQINNRGDCSIELFKTVVGQEAFYNQWYKKASDVVCGREKSNKSNSECSTCREWYTENGNEWFQCPICEHWFTKHVLTFKSNFYFSVGRKQRVLCFTNLTVLRL